MKTLLFLLLASVCSAAQVVMTNLHTNESFSVVLYNISEPFGEFRLVCPPLTTVTASLDNNATDWGSESYPNFFNDSGTLSHDYMDTIVITHLDDYSVSVSVLPGWSWFEVLTMAFWGFCAYYAGKLCLHALASLWKNPEP